MLSLECHLNSLNFSTQLKDVENLINASCTKTTFWGSRIIKINGFTGSVYLDDIARKILKAGRERSDADDLTITERMSGMEIVKKLQKFYCDTDIKIQNSNLFTKFLNWIREFSCIPYTTRFYLEETADSNFRAYSQAKFLEQFGGTADGITNHSAFAGSFGPPLRIMAKEDRIRALFPV